MTVITFEQGTRLIEAVTKLFGAPTDPADWSPAWWSNVYTAQARGNDPEATLSEPKTAPN